VQVSYNYNYHLWNVYYALDSSQVLYLMLKTALQSGHLYLLLQTLKLRIRNLSNSPCPVDGAGFET
jgi:hypothetical protein